MQFNQFLKRGSRAYAHLSVRIIQGLDERSLKLRKEGFQHRAYL